MAALQSTENVADHNHGQRRVLLTYGVFDGLDMQRTRVLRHLSTLCDELIVGCASDTLIAARGQSALLPFSARMALLEKCRFVDRVIAETTEDQQRTDIVNYNAALFAVERQVGQDFSELEAITQVLYLTSDSATLPVFSARVPDWEVA